MKQGFVSLIVLISMLLLQCSLFAVIGLVKENNELTILNCDSIKAQYLAESGLAIATARLELDNVLAGQTIRSEFTAKPDINEALGTGEICVYIKGDSVERQLISVGCTGTVRREIVAIVRKNEIDNTYVISKIIN